MGPLQHHFRQFVLYNRWANLQLYRALEGCSKEDLNENRGAYFHSILGTLNHLLVTDRMWRARLQGTSPAGVKLDAILFDELDPLAQARRAEDRALIDVVTGFSEPEMTEPRSYLTSSGAPHTQTLRDLLAHIFNHQTHHRGQAHDLIGQALGTGRTPVLDLVHYQRTAGAGDAP